MKTLIAILFVSINLVTAQDPVTIGVESNAATGLFGGIGSSIGSTLTGFLPSFSGLPGLSLGPIPCVGLTTFTSGSCLSEEACSATGGSGDSGCMSSGQVCCMAPAKCGAIVAGADAWIINDDFPNATIAQQNCVYTINKASPVVSQLKIELDSVTLAGPSPSGVCSDDRLVVEGVQGINVFPLCGSSAGSHINLPFTGPSVALRVVVSGTSSVQRKWRIHLKQVAHNTAAIAPAGCSQVFSADGHLSSINPGVGGLKYAICFQKPAGTCGLRIDASSLLQSRPSPVGTQINQLATVQPQQGLVNRLAKRQISLPPLVRTDITSNPQTGTVTADADILNLSLLGRNLIDISKQVVVENPVQPTAAPPAPVQPAPVQRQAQPVNNKPMTPHYYGGRYYAHNLPAPAYAAPLPAPAPTAAPVLPPKPAPVLQKSLVLGAGVPGLIGVQENITAQLPTLLPAVPTINNQVVNPLLPSLALPQLPQLPLPTLPQLQLPTLPGLTLPALVPTTIQSSNQTGTLNATASLFNLGLLGQPLLGVRKEVSVENAVPIASNNNGNKDGNNIINNLNNNIDQQVRSRRQEPNLCHEYIFLAPNTLVCVEPGKYNGPAEIVLRGSPLVAYIESSSSAPAGNNWKLPFNFIAC